MAPMSSERMVAARRRTGSGSGFDTASAAQSISLRVLAAAWGRAGFGLGVMRGCYEKTCIYRMDCGNRFRGWKGRLMRIWHHSFTDLTVMPLYRKTIAEHAAAVMGKDATVSVH